MIDWLCCVIYRAVWQTACDRLAERLTDAAGDWMTCVTGLVAVMLVNRTDWCILTGARRCTLTASCRWYGRSDSSWMSELKCACLIQLIGRIAWLFNCAIALCLIVVCDWLSIPVPLDLMIITDWCCELKSVWLSNWLTYYDSYDRTRMSMENCFITC